MTPVTLTIAGNDSGVAAVILTDTDEVLLLKRADNEQWALPTGTVKPGESVIAALQRELTEELNILITAIQATGIYSDSPAQLSKYPSGEIVHFVTTCFRCRIAAESLQPRPDHDEVTAVQSTRRDELSPEMFVMRPQWIADAFDPEFTVR